MWAKGQSGNANGRPKNKIIRDAFLNCLSFSEAEKLAKKILAKAQDGDMEAAKFVRDTVDGLPKQEVEIHDERSAGLAERFTELLSEGHRRVDPGRESGTGRVN